MANTEILQRTVGELVAEDYRRATVFKLHGIDFCCGGGATLERACEKRGVATGDMLLALDEAENRGTSNSTPSANLAPDTLADHIEQKHHTYVRECIPVMREFTQKVARVHGHASPELVEIADIFDKVADEMTAHMEKEERILFPYVRYLAQCAHARPVSPFGSVRNPIRMMEDDHQKVADLFREIRRLSNDYSPPDHACATYRVSFAKLAEFEDDLHLHVHLENNVLFPMAAELEERLAFNPINASTARSANSSGANTGAP